MYVPDFCISNVCRATVFLSAGIGNIQALRNAAERENGSPPAGAIRFTLSALDGDHAALQETLLEKLPGVGHKTASVVMSQAFGHPAFPVDTHIHRLAQRWGLTNGKNVIQTEKDLKRLFPKKFWNKLHLQIIYYGREYCKARECYGLTCKICTTCYPNRKKPIKTKKA